MTIKQICLKWINTEIKKSKTWVKTKNQKHDHYAIMTRRFEKWPNGTSRNKNEKYNIWI